MIEINDIGSLNSGARIFIFGDSKDSFCFRRDSYCSSCYGEINIEYIKIIEELKEAGLLKEDYPLLCCECYYDRNIRR